MKIVARLTADTEEYGLDENGDVFIHAGEEWRKIHGQTAKKVQQAFERAGSIARAAAEWKTMDDLRFCFQGCCRFINNRPVRDAEYQEFARRPVISSFDPSVELLICVSARPRRP